MRQSLECSRMSPIQTWGRNREEALYSPDQTMMPLLCSGCFGAESTVIRGNTALRNAVQRVPHPPESRKTAFSEAWQGK